MINHTTENNNSEIQCRFGDAIKELGICKLLKKSNIRKEKGGSVYEIFQFLILLLVFRNCNLFHFLNSKKQDIAFSKNTYYRFLNEPRYNWQRFLSLPSARVVAYFSSLTHRERVKCLVLDDSVIERNRSKQVELLSWIHNHVTHRMFRRFNILALGWTDGYSFVPIAFNMMHLLIPENASAASGIDRRKSGYKRHQEAVCHKLDAAMTMIRNTLKVGIQASYILIDTRFTNKPFINNILSESLDVIGMLKDNKQLYRCQGRLYNLKALSKLVAFNKAGNVFGSITVTTKKHSIPIKLVFVRNRNKAGEYIILLTTDCSLSNGEVVRLYGNQWNIELFFRAGKSLLCLGSEFQGLSYDMTVSSTAIVFTRFILLEWLRRKANDPKTIFELFYVCCDDIQDIELCTALSSLVSIFMEGLRTETIRITNAVKTQLINWFVSQPAFIKALFPEVAWEV